MPVISLVGDLMLRGRIGEEHLQDGSSLRNVIGELSKVDEVIANLEMPLSRRGHPAPKWSNLRSDPAVIEDVVALGVDTVALANNHMLDYGPHALSDTLAACDGAGLRCCGAGENLSEAIKPVTLDLDGYRVALINVSSTLPEGSAATEGRSGIAPLRARFSFDVDTNLMAEQPGTVPNVRSWADEDDLERVCEVISTAATQHDLVILGIHWGVPEFWLSPYLGLLAEYQQPAARAMIDAGANVIWGHHSHSLHPVEIYRHGLICYSQGNFLFERPRGFMRPESFILNLRREGGNLTAEFVPLMLDTDGFPSLARGDEGVQVLNYLDEISESFPGEMRREGDLGVMQISLR